MAYTLADLRTLVLQRADMESGGLVTSGSLELDNYINDSYEELWDLLVTVYSDEYFIAVACAKTQIGCASVALPDNFYKLVTIIWNRTGGERITLDRFDFSEIPERDSDGGWAGRRPCYRLTYNSLLFYPRPQTEEDLELWFVPTCPRLSSADATADAIRTPAWAEYVVTDAAIKCLQKEESDVSALEARKLALAERIRQSAPGRDLRQPQTILDLRAMQDDYYEGW